MTKAFRMSYLPTSSLSTLTPSSLTFPYAVHLSHTEILIFSQIDDALFHLWPPLLGQPKLLDMANFYCLSRLNVDATYSRKSSQCPNIGLGISLGLLQFPAFTASTTPLTLTFSCPSTSPERKLPEDRA